ncbi:hypothetical protein Tco_0953131 [Tanacetum coccineum]|uniref:Reverse transcriptase domain-containing protein n=1 Tax=Tanacetum coccineum TaxID=301880 RepID=A0ABQ5E1W5_9ASTR
MQNYLNNFRVEDKSKEEHEVHMKLVLESLKKEKLYAKFSKSSVVSDALGRKERVKSRRVRGMIMAAQSEPFKQENVLAERLHALDPQMERKGDESLRFCRERRLEDAIGFEYCLASSSGWTKSPVLWVEIGETSLTGLELLQEMTGKVTPWKSVVHFGKKGKLVPRYVGPFEILERIGLKCLADANMHVPLDEIKVDKTLRFVEEPVETMDREIKKLKRRKIVPVKVGWNQKCGPEFIRNTKSPTRI